MPADLPAIRDRLRRGDMDAGAAIEALHDVLAECERLRARNRRLAKMARYPLADCFTRLSAWCPRSSLGKEPSDAG